MSIPSIPGYLGAPGSDSLASLWRRPPGEFPMELWPTAQLQKIVRSPTQWLTIEEHFFREELHGGISCVLVEAGRAEAALETTSWIGTYLGKVSIFNDDTFENGLVADDDGIQVEFFVQSRRPSGSSLPIIEISHPFLWHWDAFPVPNGWKYLNAAGREQDLIRFEVSEDAWRVDVRALEFRSFLATCQRDAIIQVEFVSKADAPPFDRTEDSFRNEWASLNFVAVHEPFSGPRPAYSTILGKYIVTGMRNSRVPRFLERRNKQEYATFIYDIDSETGEPLTHTCDPDKLGTYFDKDGTRLHYLTPIYFKREVLQPYAAEPGRYRITASRLSCLDLWGIDISFNSADLVEVYLGDLGRDLPPDEWGHWRSYNVPPEGRMDEGRFRRDFLNQVASSRNPVGDLRRARALAVATSEKYLGAPIWKPLGNQLRAEFESLIGPLTDDPAALGGPILVLTKALVDAIDPRVLKAQLSGAYESGDQSLRLLQRYMERLGDEEDVTAILRDLQMFRSKGGIAHFAGSGKDKAFAALGIAGMSNLEAFESIVMRAAECLKAVARLIEEAHRENS